MDGEGFGEDLADGHARIERGVGVLKDDGEMAAEATEIAGREGKEIDSFVRGGVVEDFAGSGFDEAEENASEGGFAGAGFADEAEGFAAMQGDGDIGEDAVGADVLGEVSCGEKHQVFSLKMICQPAAVFSKI